MINFENNPEFVNDFLQYSLTYQRKSLNSVDQYNSDLNIFLKYMKYLLKLTNKKELSEINIDDFSLKQLELITQSHIHTFISYLSLNRNCGPATCARKISTLRIFFKYLTNTTHLLKINPAQNLETPKLSKHLPKYLSLEDSIKLLTTTSPKNNDKNSIRDFTIITLFINCGLRLSELVGINLNDFNLNEKKLNVVGKGNKERIIYLNEACINSLTSYLEIRNTITGKSDNKNSDIALFLSNTKQRISKRTVEYIVDKQLKKAGLDTSKYSTHKLRHTAATLMYQNGVDIRALQELLGHESISTTEIYTHVNNEQLKKAVESNPLAKFKH